MYFLYLAIGLAVGVLEGFMGVGGGVILIPAMVYILRMDQHVAQGTSLVALAPPTGLLAFLNYASAGKVEWTVGLWIMPGVFLGTMTGAHFAEELSSRILRRAVAVLLLVIGVWEALPLLRN